MQHIPADWEFVTLDLLDIVISLVKLPEVSVHEDAFKVLKFLSDAGAIQLRSEDKIVWQVRKGN